MAGVTFLVDLLSHLAIGWIERLRSVRYQLSVSADFDATVNGGVGVRFYFKN
ncbi:MAG: hypothetical protein IPN19_11055 [Elusimicrobia bacterium]|nr:hypothetical protein [Elusimicrobiota bacterium]